tara:strand:- start:66560 stop:66748 length:189 start_codon:yes stop_codon:yes gene_type:complete
MTTHDLNPGVSFAYQGNDYTILEVDRFRDVLTVRDKQGNTVELDYVQSIVEGAELWPYGYDV